jgi:serine/threonine-protein phosphatase CPPED1
MIKFPTIFKSIITCLVLILVFPGNGLTQNSNPPWFFIHLTDPQFGMFENNEGFEKETILYEKAVTEINRLRPDFVVITGDFVHDQHSQVQIEEFLRITANIHRDIPVYFTPGNHDIGRDPDKQSLKKYTRLYGKDRFAFKHKGSYLIGFNSNLLKSDSQRKEQGQFKWLGSNLKKGQQANHLIIFCHHPFFIKTSDEAETNSNLGIISRQKYLSLFHANNVKAVFSGHYHNNNLSTYRNIQLITTSAVGKPLGEAPSGMRIVKIYNNKIEHEYYGLDDTPNSIIFDLQ